MLQIATVPSRMMPRDVCVEIIWELAHSPEIDEDEYDYLINNLREICPPMDTL